MMAALEYDCVVVRYEAHAAATIDGVSLAVAAGERIALAGLNGSGKTTLLMAAVGLVGHEGAIRVGGSVVSRRTLEEIRQGIGFVFNVPEDQLLFPKVADDAAFALVRRGMAVPQARRRATEVLGWLGVEHLAESPLHHLSHGQKQRVALAGALVSGPSLLLLDEPSAALDPRGKRELARVLGGLDAAMLMATHDLSFAADVCTRYVVLERGRVAYDGPSRAEAERLL